MDADHRRGWLRQRISSILRGLGHARTSRAAADQVDALLRAAAEEEAERDGAQRELLGLLLQRLARVQPNEDAAVLELLSATLETPADTAEIRQIAALVRGMELPSGGGNEAGEDPPGAIDPTAEHRANNLFKDHLEHRSREFESLRAQLCQQARETLEANLDARRLLDALITRLQLGTTLPEVLDTRLEMAEEVQRIADAHETAGKKLEETFTSLQSLATDNERLQEELQRVRVLSLTDESTNLPNRRALMRQLKAEAARARREGGRFSVAILDLDHFKAINDRHGHGAGDEVLRTYAAEVLSAFRAHDLVARYGGEEFAILLPSTPAADACRAVAKIRELADGMAIDWEGRRIPLPTFSAGVAEFSGSESPEALINRADRALYRAKANGRDRIELDPPGPAAEGARPRLLRDPPHDERARGVSH